MGIKGFNSILVWLKGSLLIWCGLILMGFNSILVWLKDWYGDDGVPSHTAFQFHSGLIKRMSLQTSIQSAVRFQFHSGLIKSISSLPCPPACNLFQFHSGLIKSIFYPAIEEVAELSFNSILVWLKVSPAFYDDGWYMLRFNSILVWLKGNYSKSYSCRKPVSIPFWSD